MEIFKKMMLFFSGFYAVAALMREEFLFNKQNSIKAGCYTYSEAEMSRNYV